MVAVGGISSLSACLDVENLSFDSELKDSSNQPNAPSKQPTSQHFWDNYLRDAGNDFSFPALPLHHLILLIDLSHVPTVQERKEFERFFNYLERSFKWSNDGLVFTVGYTRKYFDRYQTSLPSYVDLPPAHPINDGEDPDFYDSDVALHMASDKASNILAAEETLLGNFDGLSGTNLNISLEEIISEVQRLTGFYLLDEYEVDGTLKGVYNQTVMKNTDFNLPDYVHVSKATPRFMGPPMNIKSSNASEETVMIKKGPFKGGATQHIESISMDLESWSELSPLRQEKLTWNAGTSTDTAGTAKEQEMRTKVNFALQNAREQGMVGHAEKVTRARKGGRPTIMRRDFNTLDLDRPGLHFVTLHKSISEYERVRNIMYGTEFANKFENIGQERNNGLLEFIETEARGNFLIPPRKYRAFPPPNPS